MALLSWHSGRRGFLGFLTYITGSDGVSRGGVIPAMSLVDSTGAEAPAGTSTSPIYTQGTSTTPAVLAAATALDARSYGSAMFQIAGLSGGDTIAVTGSLDGTNYTTLTGVGADFTTPQPIAADGIYSFPGGMYLKWAKTGSASSPVVTVRLGA